MGLVYEKIFKPLLFTQDAERSHDYIVMALKAFSNVTPLVRLMQWYNKSKADPIELFGITFPNRIGLAAGFDKNAECWRAIPAFGFGHVEIGTVTLQRQPGNPKPRLYRFIEDEAIINRLGFNNDGAEIIAERLAKGPSKNKRPVPLGINIGKSKAVPIDEAVDEYLTLFQLLADHADFLTINVSSPNTKGLRDLQSKEHLPFFLSALSKANADRTRKMGTKKIPMLLKIAPDLSFPEIDAILETIQNLNFAGIVATNTTLQRPGSFEKVVCAGGLSGRPLHVFSLDIINYIYRATSGKLPIVGVGGIMDPESAGKTLDAGASLLQLYTGLIYKGPFLGKDLAKATAWTHRDWIKS